jgi:hypothetical protein
MHIKTSCLCTALPSSVDRLRSNTLRTVPKIVARSVRLTAGRSAKVASDALANMAAVAASTRRPNASISGSLSSSTTDRQRARVTSARSVLAFQELYERKGWGAEEIAARFGVTPHVVRQRLRLGAVSPRLIQVYRDGGLTLDQLMAFAIVEDHARQERVYDNLSYNRDPSLIRRDLTRMNVPATDRRAIFVGPDAYTEAGGTILRDLFTEDRGGFFDDMALLDRLVIEKLEEIAAEVQAEGWKRTRVHIDYPHAHGMRRSYPQMQELRRG